MQLIEHSESPRYVRLHDDDNVVVGANDGGLGEGESAADGPTRVRSDERRVGKGRRQRGER